MASLGARVVGLLLPLLGIKRFFAQTDRMEARIAKMRDRKTPQPASKWHRRYDVVENTARGYPVVTFTPKGGAQPGAPHLLYLHGGGYVMDIARQHYDLVGKLCDELGACATVPLYPLAPGSKASATLEAMRALYHDLCERHGHDRITILGDSAGGGMTLALAQILKAEGSPLPASLVLYSPWLDASASGEGQRAIESKDAMLAVDGLEKCGDLYRGELDIDDPRVSPLFGSLDGLPPMAIFSGTRDILLVDGRRLAERLESEGVQNFAYHEYPGMMHVWMIFPISEARKTVAQTALFIQENAT